MERIGVRGNILQLFNSYLKLRKFKVKIGNTLSDEILITHGVPQGSKLGPILYLLYANDLLSVLNDSTTFAYADDTAVIVTHNDLNMAINVLQRELNIATKWCHDNGLIINASKTKIMHIKPRSLRHANINIKFHDIQCIHDDKTTDDDNCNTFIELVQTYKYLGVYVDHDFKWRTHIEEVQKKIRKSSIMLYHLSYSATYSVLRQAYFSLVEAYIRHGITAWGSSTYCSTLQNTQNKALKILWKNLYKSKNPNINNLNNNRNSTTTINRSNNIINESINNTLETNNNITIVNNMNVSQPDNNFPTITRNNTNKNINRGNNNFESSKLKPNLLRDLQIMSISNIFKITLINNFQHETRFLQKIEHRYNTRLRVEGRFKTNKFKNNYGKSKLDVQLPKIMNSLPNIILTIRNNFKRKKEIKKFFLRNEK